jgi:colanic acid biosynthesis protein WcaH
MLISKELYDQICRVMPIPCIDLLVTDETGRVLLLKRKNEPMKGQWWFPGGRVFFNETRCQALIRKLKEECNLSPLTTKELGTFDLILDKPSNNLPCHAITTLFLVLVGRKSSLKIDEQSYKAEWHTPEEWMERNLHEFVKNHLTHGNLEEKNDYRKT